MATNSPPLRQVAAPFRHRLVSAEKEAGRIPRGFFHRGDFVSKTNGFNLSRLCLLVFVMGVTAAYGRQTMEGDLSTTYVPANNSSGHRMNAPPAMNAPPGMGRASPATIIKNFIDAEKRFRETLVQFSFKRDVTLQTIGPQGEVTGEYIRNSIFVLDDKGRRVERVIYHPKPTLKELGITKEDIQDLAGSQLFGLELSDLTSYNLSYLGEETVNGRPMYVVAVSPSQEPDPRHMRLRFFVGRFWIEPGTFQPVYLEGITEPHGKQRFPSFRTERQIEIGNLRFPSSTYADDVLRFPRQNVHYRIKARYYDFKRFAGRVKIVEID